MIWNRRNPDRGYEGAAAGAERRIVGAFVLVLGLLLAVGATSFGRFSRTLETTQLRSRSREVLESLRSLLAELRAVEANHRGYLLTSQDLYLEPYHRGLDRVAQDLLRLVRLTADTPAQQARVNALQPVVDRRLEQARDSLDLYRKQGFAVAQAQIASGGERRSMDEVLIRIDELEREEQRLLAEREAHAGADASRTAWLIMSGNALALAVVAMAAWYLVRSSRALRASMATIRTEEWQQASAAALGELLREERPVDELGRAVLERLAALLDAQVLTLYRRDGDDGAMAFVAGHGLDSPRRPRLLPDEGLVGDAVRRRRRIDLTRVPIGYLTVATTLGSAEPRQVTILPLCYHDQVEGVLELAWLATPDPARLPFLDRAAANIAAALASCRARAQIQALLTTSRQQAEQLRVQREDLTRSNEELNQQARALADRHQQAETQNRAIDAVRRDLERQAEQLAAASTYKSQFLSNMSHELRTPLNSLLILSQQLYENPAGNLDEQQVRYARTIHSSGRDLLALITDVLDLAKIESGTVAVDFGELRFALLCDALERTLRPLAEQKGLEFAIQLAADLPESLVSDAQRVQQVLTNLLANAIKFTPQSGDGGRRGRVTLAIGPAADGWSAHRAQLATAPAVIAFTVRDNGIGIPPAQQEAVFEAFQQADGGIARKYGGTGLGLSISRQLAILLDGELRLVQSDADGSTFTLFLPGTDIEAAAAAPLTAAPVVAAPETGERFAAAGALATAPALIEDDRGQCSPGDRVVLIVEDDPVFAQILVEVAHEQALKAVVVHQGGAVLALARELQPVAITLDIQLADGNGWPLFDRLKHDRRTRHIPVKVITGDEDRTRALRQGARAVLAKPASREALGRALAEVAQFRDHGPRRLLLIEDHQVTARAIVAAVGNGDVVVTAVGSAEAALEALAAEHFDCMILDLGLPAMSGQQLLDRLEADPTWREIPVVIYTARDVGAIEDQRLRRRAQTIVLKTASSLDRLMEETALFLHRDHSRLPTPNRQRSEHLHQLDAVLSGRTVLVADDDVRNVFALTSLLERYGMTVVTAENGREALARMDETPDVALVLMDLMMPELDGLQAMRTIRARPEWHDLPILALTAKAQAGDRAECLAAGASDYITKPIDSEQLLSMLRVRLYR